MEPILFKILALLSVPKIGPTSLKKLFLLSPELAFLDQLDPKAWQAELKLPLALGQAIAHQLRLDETKKKFEAELEQARLHQTSLIPYNAKAYPALLREIAAPPPILYLKGNLKVFQDFSLGVVGTRKATYHGVRMTKKLLADFAHTRYSSAHNPAPFHARPLIVSGLAIGIDTHAHTAALENNLPTVAVLANGLASVYPFANQALAEKILDQGGALISEQPMATKPLPNYFPLRNRIISGLSQAVLVMEASLKSGSLITARYALEQNREVFALLGPLDAENYAGCVALVDQQKARPITSAASILETLLPLNLRPEGPLKLSSPAWPVAQAFNKTPKPSIEPIPPQTGLAAPSPPTAQPETADDGQLLGSLLDPDFFFQASMAIEEEEGLDWEAAEAQPEAGSKEALHGPLGKEPSQKESEGSPIISTKLQTESHPKSVVSPVGEPEAELREGAGAAWDPQLWQVFQQNFRCRLEEICQKLGWEASSALARLIQLEILGQIREVEPGVYELSDDVRISPNQNDL